jgi:nucleoside phosphorylase
MEPEIGLVCAMVQEAEHVRIALKLEDFTSQLRNPDGNLLFKNGNIAMIVPTVPKIVLDQISIEQIPTIGGIRVLGNVGIGPAATATQKLIDTFPNSIKDVVNIGLAGSVQEEFNAPNVYIGSQVSQ